MKKKIIIAILVIILIVGGLYIFRGGEPEIDTDVIGERENFSYQDSDFISQVSEEGDLEFIETYYYVTDREVDSVVNYYKEEFPQLNIEENSGRYILYGSNFVDLFSHIEDMSEDELSQWITERKDSSPLMALIYIFQYGPVVEDNLQQYEDSLMDRTIISITYF